MKKASEITGEAQNTTYNVWISGLLALVIIAILFGAVAILFGWDSPFCEVCNQAKANCHNGYRINEHCTKGIYGYECTNDGQNITYMCAVG